MELRHQFTEIINWWVIILRVLIRRDYVFLSGSFKIQYDARQAGGRNQPRNRCALCQLFSFLNSWLLEFLCSWFPDFLISCVLVFFFLVSLLFTFSPFGLLKLDTGNWKLCFYLCKSAKISAICGRNLWLNSLWKTTYAKNTCRPLMSSGILLMLFWRPLEYFWMLSDDLWWLLMITDDSWMQLGATTDALLTTTDSVLTTTDDNGWQQMTACRSDKF